MDNKYVTPLKLTNSRHAVQLLLRCSLARCQCEVWMPTDASSDHYLLYVPIHHYIMKIPTAANSCGFVQNCNSKKSMGTVPLLTSLRSVQQQQPTTTTQTQYCYLHSNYDKLVYYFSSLGQNRILQSLVQTVVSYCR